MVGPTQGRRTVLVRLLSTEEDDEALSEVDSLDLLYRCWILLSRDGFVAWILSPYSRRSRLDSTKYHANA